MLSPKVLLISVAVTFAALGLKAYLPFIASHLPLLWSFFLLCFKPPYLYIIVNAIIISIVASSRFHHSAAEEPNHHMDEPTPPTVPEPPVLEVKAVLVNGSPAVEQEKEVEEEEKRVIDLGIVLKRMDSPEIPPEYLSPMQKPLVSARFAHRKPLKSSPEVIGGRALRVAKPKRHETLENTWKMITEGRSMPLSRHMKKCDTWQSRGDMGPVEVNKCETFNINRPPLAGKLRKEPSLSQDELNRRVEAFIQKFNEQMRLQRQESLNHCMQMINRGTT